MGDTNVCCPIPSHGQAWLYHPPQFWLFFSVIDRNVFEMTEKNKVISVRMFENLD